jgi:glycosyltransferase involved in cell wall biosynthesis
VISDHLALSKDIEANRAAVVVPRDAEQASAAIASLLSDPSAAEELGARAREYVARRFAPETVAAQLLRLGEADELVAPASAG